MKKLLTKKFLIFALCGVAAAGTGAAMLLSPGKSVATMAMSSQVLEDTFWEDGIVRAQTRNVVSADITAKVLNIAVVEGQSVKKGDALLFMDTTDLESERAQLTADKMSVLASWDQSREQVKQQIAAIEAQRASYGAANTDAYLGSQIALLERSMDTSAADSVANSYQQMLAMTNARWQYINFQMTDAMRQTPAEVQALQTQLEAAKAQQAAIENQIKQYDVQKQAQILELEAIRDNPATTNPSDYQDLIDELNSNAIDDSYTRMHGVANDQVARLQRDLGDAQAQVPQSLEALRAQQLALESERSALEEQYKQYRLSTQTQVLSLTAQQEQAAVSRASQNKARGKLGEQIDLLAQSMQDGSGSATYYAAQAAKLDAGLEDVGRRIGLAGVVAPIDGIVGAIHVSEGEYISAGMMITEVVDPASLKVECMLLTDDADSVSDKTPVRIVWERRDGNVDYSGSVQSISSLAVNSISAVGLNEQRVKVTLEPEFSDENHPKHGYQVRVQFTTASQTALSVLRSALVKTDQGDAVYVIKNGRAALTHVELGMESGERVAVESGLAPDDIVINNPEADGVIDGAAIKAAGK